MPQPAPRPDLLATALHWAAMRLPPDVSNEGLIIEAMKCVDSLREGDREQVRASLAVLAEPPPPPQIDMWRWLLHGLAYTYGEPCCERTVRLPEWPEPPAAAAA